MSARRIMLAAALQPAFLAGCAIDHVGRGDDRRHFSSPEQAVEETARLLREESWRELTTYYDLSGSEIDRGELESGQFFIRDDRPQRAHPAGLWRYREPFPPGFRFDRVLDTADPSIVQVVVSIEIDQGEGLPQRGMRSFRMRNSEAGYRLLPQVGGTGD